MPEKEYKLTEELEAKLKGYRNYEKIKYNIS
jgi:hypothetical protein